MGSITKLIDLRHHVKSNRFFSGAGRGELLSQLRRRAQSSELNICAVSGPDGIGKTALLTELRDDMRSHMRVISFSGHYGCFEKVLEQIAENLNITLNPEHSATQWREQINQQLTQKVHDKPLLVLFDDAHALPLPVIRELLELLAAPGSSCSVLFVDNEVVDVVCNFLHRQKVEILNLRRVYRQEMAAYLSHHYHQAVNFTELELDTIFEASEGVPLRINQQAEYALRARAVQCDVANQVARTTTPVALQTLWEQGQPGAWVAAACLTAAISVTSLYSALNNTSSSLQTNKETKVLDVLLEEEDEQLLAEEGFEVELPEEFVEFSDQLSNDEIELLQTGADQYVLQLKAGSSESDMETFIADHAEYDLKMYRSLTDGEPWYKAVTQSYEDPNDAIEVANTLPQELREEKPWVRSVASVQQEILQMGELHLSEQEELSRNWLAFIDRAVMRGAAI